jgi:phage gp46-like protein
MGNSWIHLSGVDLGNLPSWFAALGTTAALGISLWLLRQQAHDREVEGLARRAGSMHG